MKGGPDTTKSTLPRNPTTRVTRDVVPVDNAPDNTSPRVVRDLVPTQPKPSPNPVTRVTRENYPTQ